RRAGPVRELVLTTTKRPEVLVQAWMDDDLRDRLRSGTERVAVFDGPAADAVRLFPQSVNAAATLALAAGSWDVVRVQVVGDPTAERNRHEIRFEGAAGRYHLTIENEPSVTNPKTSGIVPYAVLRGLEHWVAEDWTLI
ncbi:MAG: aspartate dehydrogenase domain-containing protein, partial [Actinomycetota bacterium]